MGTWPSPPLKVADNCKARSDCDGFCRAIELTERSTIWYNNNVDTLRRLEFFLGGEIGDSCLMPETVQRPNLPESVSPESGQKEVSSGSIAIRGGRPLKGTIAISGSKNAALPIIAATVLVEGKTLLRNIPNLLDVSVICEMLERLGARTEYNVRGHTLEVDARSVKSTEVPLDLVRRMRASFLVLGPLLARFGEAHVPLPGGCNIGTRSVDSHLNGLRSMDVEIQIEKGMVNARSTRLNGASIYLEEASVGATENLMMAACIARGKTQLFNCAEEPEIVDLANFLRNVGARIEGAGTKTITIWGQQRLTSGEYRIVNDRIEAGTYLFAAVATGGEVTVTDMNPEHLEGPITKLREMGVTLDIGRETVTAIGPHVLLPTNVRTQVYPGFPTDLQPQFCALATGCAGTSLVTETLYESRFNHIAELNRMGAKITVRGTTAIIEGTPGGLTGVPVRAYDIRGGAALVVAALSAEGETVIEDVGYLDRGYERIEEKLASLGSIISRKS